MAPRKRRPLERLGEVAFIAMVPKTDGDVRSAFFGDSKEGLHLVRAYTKRIDATEGTKVQREPRAAIRLLSIRVRF